MLTLLYVLAFLDRGNIGNAKVAGMNKELNLTGTQYNIALTVSMVAYSHVHTNDVFLQVFFFPYSVFEVPSNIVLKLMRPSLWITILMLSWGVVRPTPH